MEMKERFIMLLEAMAVTVRESSAEDFSQLCFALLLCHQAQGHLDYLTNIKDHPTEFRQHVVLMMLHSLADEAGIRDFAQALLDFNAQRPELFDLMRSTAQGLS